MGCKTGFLSWFGHSRGGSVTLRLQPNKRPVKSAPSLCENQLWLPLKPLSLSMWIIANYLQLLMIIICFPYCHEQDAGVAITEIPVGDYRLKYMAAIIPTNGRAAQSMGCIYRAQNCTSNSEPRFLRPGHFSLCSVVYGGLLPAFMAALFCGFNSDNMQLTHSSSWRNDAA